MAKDVDLTAYRHATWGDPDGAGNVAFLGVDLSQSTFAWSFADGEGGPVRFTLENAPSGSQGLSASYHAQYLHPVTGRPVGATILVPQINEATLEALPDPHVPTDTIVLTHTLYVTRPGKPKQAVFAGHFTIRQGAPN